MSETESATTKPAPPREARWERTKANIKTIGGAVLLALFIRIVLFEAFEIEGPSMEPTLLNGDRVVVAKFLYGLSIPFRNDALFTWGLPNVGDVVIVRSPADDIDIVKRVIGVPGDRIEMREDEVFRNGVSIRRGQGVRCYAPREEFHPDFVCDEEGVGDHTWQTGHAPLNGTDSRDEVTVPEGHIYVLGDHRDRSNDSRAAPVGMIPAERIKGRALAIYLSHDGGFRVDRIFSRVH
jgi:signal peptidase I